MGFVRNGQGKCVAVDSCPKKCGQKDRTRSGKSAQAATEPARTLILSVPWNVSLPSVSARADLSATAKESACCGQLPEEMWTERDLARVLRLRRNLPDPICTLECKPPKCQCKSGFVRNGQGKCVAVDSCPKKCEQNEVWQVCSSCERTCQNPNPICPPVCQPPKCECKIGFVRNAHGKCVSLNRCPKKCGQNEVWRECSGCDGTCQNPNPICPKNCQPPKCQCKSGFVRNAQGKCVALSSCPQEKCGKNQIWRECSTCDGTCKDPFPVCSKECKPPRCMCLPGFVRDSLDECVDIKDCPKS
ncbi:hypothetical protein L596_013899 [Steinernema carpocapsae]|uniref:TIL domain-containing protein n=1 Tax=Steinernema carpocapsae TaxID=34508 RepID=A0A4U5P1K4_STECR|nr:hypothetical protein L596_013899 [Steinernema carpocapsae]